MNGFSRVEEIHDSHNENQTVDGSRPIGNRGRYQDSPGPVDSAELPADPLETERHADHEQWTTETQTSSEF